MNSVSLHVTLPFARSLNNIIKKYSFGTHLFLPFQRVIFTDSILYAQGKTEKIFCDSCLFTILCSQNKKSL